MDLKLKGKSWAGNIYHQFESICHDVDDFMNKDTVKFVENQVQSVGVNFKRFYSNVVQDILPHAGDTVKSELQSVEDEPVDAQDHVNSIPDIITEPIRVNENHSSTNQSSIDTIANSDAPSPVELGHGMQFMRTPYMDLSQELESHLQFTEDGDGIVPNADHSEGSMLLAAKSSSRKDVFSETSNEYNNFIPALGSLPVPSAHETGTSDKYLVDSALDADTAPIKKEIISCNSYSDDYACPSNISISDCGISSKLPIGDNPNISVLSETSADKGYECVKMESLVCSSISDENRSVSALSVTSANEVNGLEFPTMVKLPPSTSDAAEGTLATDGILSDSFLTKDESFNASNSVHDKEERMNVHLYPRSTSPKFSNILKSRSADFMKDAEDIHHFHAESGQCAHSVSTRSEAVVYESKAVDALPALLISELNENTVCSSVRRQEHNDLKLSTSSSGIGVTHEFDVSLCDLNMETIDLSSDTKHDEERVILNAVFPHSTSHRTKNFQYFKKLIKDAFTSRKRLSKEYKHLPILYGDIDKEASQLFQPSFAPSSPDIHLHATETRLSQEMCETEWELL